MSSVENLQGTLWPLLAPFGWVWGRAMDLRASLYASGALASFTPNVPTVSVGNIGWGGSGKTPLAGWLLNWAVDRGLDPVLLTRGYRSKPKSLPYRVTADALAEEAGDEPLLLARQNPGATVLVDPVRKRAAALAQEKFRPRLFVLDDGFQHLAVRRDLDLVLLRPRDLGPGWGRVSPAGTWRESERALERAHAFLIKAPSRRFKDLAEVVRERLAPYGKPIFSMNLRPMGVRNLRTGAEQDDFAGQPYLLVSGVAGPGQVAVTAARLLGTGPVEHLSFNDHHLFTERDVLDIQARASRLGVRHVLCTAKDGVKLGPMAKSNFFSLEVRVSFGPRLGCDQDFPQWWADRFEELRLGKGGKLHEPEADKVPDQDGAPDGQAPPEP